MRRMPVLGLTLLSCLLGMTQPEAKARDLTLEERIEAQEAIERVYWAHRIWPAENRGPKPPLEAVLSSVRIRARVEDYLRKSNALEEIWGRPITAAQLQAEMQRMAAQTRAPGVLREIFAALGNDPFLIAETLARQTLADHLIRGYYGRDERFHGETRREAEAALAAASSPSQLKLAGVKYSETTWRLRRSGDAVAEHPNPDEIVLDAADWRDALGRLRELPPVEAGRLQEDDRAFFVTAALREGGDAFETATAAWPKVEFETWWADRSASTSAEVATLAPGTFRGVKISAAAGCVPDTWTPIPGAPQARYQHSAVWTGTEMIVWGGSTLGIQNAPGGLFNLSDGGRYNPATDTWLPVTTTGAPPTRAVPAATVWTGREMIVWDGQSGGRYDPAADRWTAASAIGALLTYGEMTAVWTGTEMILWGTTGATNGGARYHPATDRWTAITTTGAPTARGYHSVVWTGREMIVWGGQYDDGLSTGGRYDPAADRWTATSTSGAPAGRGHHSAVWTGSEMVVWGGSVYLGGDTFVFAAGGRYNPSTNSWRGVTTTGAPAARTGQAAVWTGREMIVWGGVTGGAGVNSGTLFQDGGRYNPSTDRWLPTTISGAPGPRLSHTATWTGSEMIVWGGTLYDSQKREYTINTGGRYDPSTDSWVITPTEGPPTGRYDHTAVWTGSEMIVWGGRTNGAYSATDLDDGTRYDPATETWTPTLRGPQQRSLHTAVWTGTHMIIWGGGEQVRLNDGSRYNAADNSWARTAPSPLSPRSGHSAVWTGSRMIIWGGAAVPLSNAGALYDPSTDTWSPTPGDGAPVARSKHAAVWTGASMIVWGGFGANGVLNDGARYDPEADMWTPISMAGSPTAHAGTAGVWTGSEMIVWGASGSGGRYTPSSDTWRALSTDGAPAARHYPTAVWTGRQMILWGGLDSDIGPFGDGGRYDPSTDSWIALATAGAPPARWKHTAVLTTDGEMGEMIVWGGAGGQFFGAPGLSSGARYCVAASSCSSPGSWYRDDDGDGYGRADDRLDVCDQPAGFAARAGDCNDASPAVHPGAADICDGVDQDCNDIVDDPAAADASCGDGSACSIDVCRAGACVRFAGGDPLMICRVSQPVLMSWSNNKTFGLTVALKDSCTGKPLDPTTLGPFYVSAVESASLGQMILPTPDTGSGCTQDGIWETVSRRRRLGRGTMAVNFQARSDGRCATLDGNRRDILRLLETAPGRERAVVSLSSVYPGASQPVTCEVTVTVIAPARGRR